MIKVGQLQELQAALDKVCEWNIGSMVKGAAFRVRG